MPELELFTEILPLRNRLDEARRELQSLGFVPTMGFLHAGHVSLMDRARAENDVVVTSIFVNPLQFAPSEDLADYPRDIDRDREMCAKAGVDFLFAPAEEEMYPSPVLTQVIVSGLSEPLEGRSRPTHFAGVATVVAKLFQVVGPCSAYFGEKDYQQLAVVRRMAGDLSMPVRVVGCETVRERDGLALSSRNVYLSEAERAQAPVLREALVIGAELVESGQTDPEIVERAMVDHIRTADLATIDYAAAVPADTLVADGELAGDVRLLLAVRFGSTRLIDNVGCRARR